jgi:serine protease Do
MSKQNSRWFNSVLIITGIVIGLVLGAGFGISNSSKADTSDSPKTENKKDINVTNVDVAYALSNAFASVAEKVNPAVVTISTETTIKQRVRIPSFFEDFFGPQSDQEREYKAQGLGSGVIVRSDGVILTNNHVVDGADDIIITLIDGRELPGKVTGTDPRTDIAVIQIDAKDLPSISLGNSDNLKVGEWVLAIGSPLSPEYNHTVTAGIVSAKGRQVSGLTGVQDFIQTDAAINPGNSGGALVNLRGELIGINTAIASRTGQNSGIGFAISSNLARMVMEDILDDGKVSRGWLGVRIDRVTTEIAEMYGMKNTDGVLIRSLEKDSPAERDGIEPGDIVIAVNGQSVKTPTELSTIIGSKKPNEKVKITVIREGKEKTIEVTLGEFPAELISTNSSRENKIKDLGISVSNLDKSLRKELRLSESDYGVVVSEVIRGSVAANAGLQRGDLIMRVNRMRIKDVADFEKSLAEIEPGGVVLLQIKRDGRRMLIDFTLPKN